MNPKTQQVLVTYSRPFWRELGMSGNVMSYGGGPIQQLYDSSGPNDSAGPHALCGFVLGNGARQPPPDDALRPQVGGHSQKKPVAHTHRYANNLQRLVESVSRVAHPMFLCCSLDLLRLLGTLLVDVLHFQC